jgi:hypothetical protein
LALPTAERSARCRGSIARDDRGRAYAVITLYQADPPLTGLSRREEGFDRGTDLRSPADSGG